jgi:hypothetical protein
LRRHRRHRCDGERALLPLLAGGALLARRGTHWLSPLAVGTVANDKRPFSVIQFTLC